MEDQRNTYYNKNLQQNANSLRKNMTKAEASLWKYVLESRMLKGYQFRRQKPVLNYIADFMCKKLKLIIEVGGITHHFEETYQNDLKRQKELEEYGFTVIRFKEENILKNIEGVRQMILEEIENKLTDVVHPLYVPLYVNSNFTYFKNAGIVIWLRIFK